MHTKLPISHYMDNIAFMLTNYVVFQLFVNESMFHVKHPDSE